MIKSSFVLLFACVLAAAGSAAAYERGAIFYHSSQGDLIYGRTSVLELPCSVIKAVFGELKSGHAGLYIGDGKIIHAVREGVIETTSDNFMTKEDSDGGARFMGAKVPADYADNAKWPVERKDQLILMAKEQVGKWYDLTFHKQTGAGSGDFTCVGLVEYVYEMVGYDITPPGYYNGGPGGKTHTQTYNCESTGFTDWEGVNTFAEAVQFSKFSHPLEFFAGLDHDGSKYMFFPYTQYIQPSTVPVADDPSTPVSGGSGSGGGSGCFIATAAYGSVLDPHVDVLRTLRDKYLRVTSPGRAFIRLYSEWSPPVAGFIAEREALKGATRVLLVPVIAAAYLVSLAGLWQGAVIGGLAIAALAGAVSFLRKRKGSAVQRAARS
jgi:hypothetical protein